MARKEAGSPDDPRRGAPLIPLILHCTTLFHAPPAAEKGEGRMHRASRSLLDGARRHRDRQPGPCGLPEAPPSSW